MKIFLHKNICCGCSSESPRCMLWGLIRIASLYVVGTHQNRLAVCCGDSSESNEYPQHMFLWRTDKNYPSIIIKYPPYLFFWTYQSTSTQASSVGWRFSIPNTANSENNYRNTFIIWATSWENLFMPYANDKGADQPAQPCSLISTLVVCWLDSIISIVAK